MTRVGQEEEVVIIASNIRADYRWRVLRHRIETPLLRYCLRLTPQKELFDFLMWHFDHLNKMNFKTEYTL